MDREATQDETSMLHQRSLDVRLVCLQPVTHGAQRRRFTRSAAEDEGEVCAGRVVRPLLRQHQGLHERRPGHKLGGALAQRC